jgi:HlyD family secretion protein
MKKSKALGVAIFISVLLLGAVVTLAYVFSGQSAQSTKKEVATYKIMAQPDTLFSGTVQAQSTDDYLADTTKGTLSKINVKDGQAVKAGDVLLTYQAANADLTTLTFAVQTAQNTLDNATQNLASAKTQIVQLKTQLAQATDATEKAGIDSQVTAANQAVLQSEQAVTTAQLGLTQANTQLAQAQAGQTVTVAAKQDGIAQVNANAAAADPIVSVVSNTRIVMGSSTEFDYAKLKVGEKLSITTVNGNQKTMGLITKINQTPVQAAASATANAGSSVVTYNFIVSPDKTLQYGYTVQMGLANTEIIIPRSAVTDGKVQLKVGSHFERRTVTTEEANGQLKVLSGLKVGDVISQNGNAS